MNAQPIPSPRPTSIPDRPGRIEAVWRALRSSPFALTTFEVAERAGLTRLMAVDALNRLADDGYIEPCLILGGTAAGDVEGWRRRA